MIAHLKGTILKKTEKGIVLSTGDIGYFVFITKYILAETKEEQLIEFFIHHHIREDLSTLYGFSDYEDLEFFKILIGISGIGPKVAMEILNIPSAKMKNAIINEDTAFICKIPGIGQKTAKRIVLELKGKVTVDVLEREHGAVYQNMNEDIIDALMKLGFQKHHILKTLKDLPETMKEDEEIIGYFLKHN